MRWPVWWEWDLELTPHVLKRMLDREFTEVDQVDYFDVRWPGFGVRVSPAGRKSWIIMYRFHGRVRRVTIGPYPYVSLADARARAKAVVTQVLQGTDPAAIKAAERLAETFAQLAEEYLERHAKPRKRTWREDERILKRELLPHWGKMKAKEVTRRDVRLLIDRVVERGVTTYANRIFALERKVFNFGLQRDIVDANPCQGLPQPAPEHRRDRVLSESELAVLWKEFEAERPLVAASYKLRLLTAQRGGEILGMRWDHIDFASAWWTIPTEIAKNGMAHRVPLSRQVRRHAGLDVVEYLAHDQTRDAHPRHVAGGRPPQVMLAEVDARPRPDPLRGLLRGVHRPRACRVREDPRRGETQQLDLGQDRPVYDRHSYDREKREALDAWATRLFEIVAASATESVAEPEAQASVVEGARVVR